jgi:cbb3-type cytochrome oxidase cytochrome c subunit
MKKLSCLQIVSGFFLLLAVAFMNSAYAEDAPGKKIFIANKCNTCHSIESQAITKTLASSKAPDLSTVGTEHNADWIAKYISKQETKNEKKHIKGWTGTKEDLQTVAKWLESLKKK